MKGFQLNSLPTTQKIVNYNPEILQPNFLENDMSSLYRTAIAVVADRRYLPAAACQLISVVHHLPPQHRVSLHLALCDVSAEDVNYARRFFGTKAIEVTIHQPEFAGTEIVTLSSRWPRAAYLRLYFDRIFGNDIDRLVYFDADTRVCAPLDTLLDADLAGRPVGAVHDFIYYVTGNIRRRRVELGLAHDAPYLQSGVMVLDWRQVLASDCLGAARQVLVDNPKGCAEAPDQDALNVIFEDSWKALDPRWNLHELYLLFGGLRQPWIEHYTSTKPWSRYRPAAWRRAAAWYREELAGSAWEDFVQTQSILDRTKMRLLKFRRRVRHKGRDAIFRHAPQLLDLLGMPRLRDESRPLPWTPRDRKIVNEITEALIEEAAGRRPPIRPPEAVLDGYPARLPGAS